MNIVVTRDKAWQHARICGKTRRVDKSDFAIRNRVRAEPAHHLDMAVAAPDQHHALHGDGSGRYSGALPHSSFRRLSRPQPLR